MLAGDQPPLDIQEIQKHRLMVEAREKTWIQVRIDEKKVYSVMLHPGDRRDWEVEDHVQIVLGNGGGVQMKWDDQPVNTGVVSGQVMRFRLPDPLYGVE